MQRRRVNITSFRPPSLIAALCCCLAGFATGCDSVPPRSTPEIAAQWTLSEGGSVVISEGGRTRGVGALKKLPQGGYEVRTIRLGGAKDLQAEELANVASLHSVRVVVLSESSVTDEGLWYLSSLQNLDRLELANTEVTDVGLEYLGACGDLTSLNLAGTDVTGTGFDALLGCRKLKTLDLSRTPLRSEHVATLQGLHNLDEINLTGTGVSAASVDELRAALKYCRVTTTGD